MSAQNCQARLLFKSFKVEISVDYTATYQTANDLPNAINYTIEDNYTGTYKARDPFTAFTKRELSCPKLLAAKKATLGEVGWVHKNLDTAIRRDFSTGYPFPAINAGQGYAPPPAYYANQPYDVDEAVPLIDQLRSRQPFIPIVNNSPVTGPYYFKDGDTGIPPNLDSERFVLNPDTTVFESQDDYQKWLAKYLPTATPVYFPKAPNDPEPDANPRTVNTLFDTKAAWTSFLKDAGGRGINCGGQAQCGINLHIANVPNYEDYIQCSTTTKYTGPDAPPDTGGTAIMAYPPAFLTHFVYDPKTDNVTTYGRGYDKVDDKIQVDAVGNIKFLPWHVHPPAIPNPPPDPPDPVPPVYQVLWQIVRDNFFYQFFNNKQKGCKQLEAAVSKILKDDPDPRTFSLLPSFGNFENETGDWMPFAASGGVGTWFNRGSFTPAVQPGGGSPLVITATANYRNENLDVIRAANCNITYTITYEDL